MIRNVERVLDLVNRYMPYVIMEENRHLAEKDRMKFEFILIKHDMNVKKWVYRHLKNHYPFATHANKTLILNN